MVPTAHSTLIMLRKSDIYNTVHPIPVRGIQCPFLPTQVSHIKTRPSSTLSRVVPAIYIPSPPAASLPSLLIHDSGQEFATALSGPCPYKEVGAAAWDWGHPSLPLLTSPVQGHFRGYCYKEVSSANSPVALSQKNRSLLFTAFTIPS